MFALSAISTSAIVTKEVLVFDSMFEFVSVVRRQITVCGFGGCCLVVSERLAGAGEGEAGEESGDGTCPQHFHFTL